MMFDHKTSLTSEQIAEKIRLFNLAVPYDWSIFDDVPEWQQVNVMYPFTMKLELNSVFPRTTDVPELYNEDTAARVTETGKRILNDLYGKL